jgi:small multidrug resistance pump
LQPNAGLVIDMMWIIFVIYVFSSSLGMILIKQGGEKTSVKIIEKSIQLNINIHFIAGVLLFLLSFILWVLILQHFKLTFISPVAYGLTFLMLSFFAYVMLNEQVTIYNLIGATLIICGVVVSYIGTGAASE